MAEVLPVRGLLYEHARAGRFDDLVAPPYDVISESDRAALEAKSPFNIVRVDLPQGNREEKYRNAARELRRWIEEGILRRDRAPAFYRYQQIFSLAGREHTRKGFIGRIRLRRFEERVVLPHERTLSGPRLDRLELSRACRTNLSQVFGLYPDPAGTVDAEFTRLDSTAPAIEARLRRRAPDLAADGRGRAPAHRRSHGGQEGLHRRRAPPVRDDAGDTRRAAAAGPFIALVDRVRIDVPHRHGGPRARHPPHPPGGAWAAAVPAFALSRAPAPAFRGGEDERERRRPANCAGATGAQLPARLRRRGHAAFLAPGSGAGRRRAGAAARPGRSHPARGDPRGDPRNRPCGAGAADEPALPERLRRGPGGVPPPGRTGGVPAQSDAHRAAQGRRRCRRG